MTKSGLTSLVTLAILGSAMSYSSPAIAQVTTGTILGTVLDKSGGTIVGADVTISETSKGTSQKYQSDETGSYYAPFLIPGTYRVTVEKSGFTKQVRNNITLQVDDKVRIDFTLDVGQVTQTVEVTSSAPLVKSESAELGDVITGPSVRSLPLNGRNFAQLVYLVPGVTPGQQGENLSGASTFNPRAASNYNALGSQANTNAWVVDGIDDNEYTFNTVIVQPSVESVQEFKVLTGTYSAEFGAGAGVVSVSTRSGSNAIHGTAFEFLRNDALDAKPYQFTRTPVVKPPFRRNQFGAAVGGPIRRNRTFFFGDYYGLREIKGQSFVNSVPTAQTRNGDFSQLTDSTGNLIKVYDPLTTRPDPANPGKFLRDPFANNLILPNRFNQVGFNVASIYPLPNGSGNFNNYTSTANRTVTDDGFNARIDHRINDHDSLFGRYSYENYKLDAPQGQSACCLPTPDFAKSKFDLGPFVAGIQNTRLKAQGMALNETHIFKPTLLNEVRAGFARTTPFTVQSDFGHNSATSLGIVGINVSQFTTGLPNINVGNGSGAEVTGLSGGPAFLPANPRQTHYQVEDTMSWTLGRHQTKFGYRYIRRLVSPFTNTDTRSTLNFADNFTNNPTTNKEGSGIATLLLGFSTGGSRGFLIEPYYMTNTEHSAFFQDDWRVSARLTLNLGLRYDVFTPDVEIRNRLTNFDVANLRLVYAGEGGTSPTANKSTQYGNLGPRLGFAWDVLGDHKTILRGGYGISYFNEQASASNLIGQQVPFTISQNISPDPNSLGTDFTSGKVPSINNPFPPISPVKPITTADLNAVNPRVLGHAFNNLTPYFESWNVDIERQLSGSMLFELGYVGSRSIHLPFCYNPNEVQPGSGTAVSRRLLQPLSNLSNMTQCDPRNMSNFHALQTKLTKRFSNGLQFLSSYTWGRSLDYGSSAASGGGAVGNPQTVTNLRAGYGPSGFDVRHRFVTSYVYELPFGPGKKWGSSQGRVVAKVIGGWQQEGIVTFSSGRPFTVFLNTGVNNGAPSWPNRVCDGKLSNPTASLWFDPTCFVPPPSNTYGNSQRGALYGPRQTNFDLSFFKNTVITERLKVQFRLDAFNIFNTPFFGFPNANSGAATVGQITSTNSDMRDLQFSLKVEF